MDDRDASAPGVGAVTREELDACTGLLRRIRACTICAPFLPLGPRPIVQLHPAASILVASQAPGRKVHETGIPFNDPSGDRLLDWMGVTRAQFHDPACFAIAPMGFCYPGKGPSGDLPPRPECAPAWRASVLAILPRVELTLAIGRYAAAAHLPDLSDGLTKAIREQPGWPSLVILPHPSPTNNRWFAKHRWFEAEVVPQLHARVVFALQRARQGIAGARAFVDAMNTPGGTSPHMASRQHASSAQRRPAAFRRPSEDFAMSVSIKRAYEDPADADGTRVLVDRIWPRGVKKEALRVDHWMKEVAPSSELRKWFGHDPKKWTEFQKRYRTELRGSQSLAELRALARKEKVTLVYSARDEEHNQAVVLARMIRS